MSNNQLTTKIKNIKPSPEYNVSSRYQMTMTDNESPTKISIYYKRHIKCEWQGKKYLQEDKDYIKNTPSTLAPVTDNDGLT